MPRAPDPDPDFSNLHLLAKGGWKRGGRVLLYDGARDAGREEELAPTLFPVLALLMLQCRHDSRPASGPPAPGAAPGWRPGGFVSKAVLCRKLTEVLGVWDPDLAHYVLRLRQFLAGLALTLRHGPKGDQAARWEQAPPAWTRRLIENSRSQGYRLNLPAENLHLLLDEDEP
jgi:hypothetical protein